MTNPNLNLNMEDFDQENHREGKGCGLWTMIIFLITLALIIKGVT